MNCRNSSTPNPRRTWAWLKSGLFGAALALFGTAQAQVSVTATAGDVGPTNYATLNAAFAAINAGTPQGAIVVTVTASTTEPAPPTPLLSSGTGASSYTSILINCSGNVTVNSALAPTASRGVIEIQGADNVTIDGDDPLTAGSRNLTFQAAAVTTTGVAVVRFASTSTTNGATFCTIRNCIVIGSRNSGISTVVNYGIYSGTAVAGNTSTSGQSDNNDNMTIENNEVRRCFWGIYAAGTTANVADNLIIRNNVVGSATAADAVVNRGIYIQNTQASASAASAIVEGNDVRVTAEAGGTGNDIAHIEVANGNAGAFIRRNAIHDGIQASTGGQGCYGIYVTGSTNNAGVEISNNFIWDLNNDNWSAAISATSNDIPVGIKVSVGATGLKILHNTISLNKANNDPATAGYSACLQFHTTGATGSDIRNNIFSNTQTSQPTSVHVGVLVPSGFPFGTINNNAYYPLGAGHFTGWNGANRATLGDWQTATGQDGASIADAPPFVSSTDLHIQTTPAVPALPFYLTGATGTGVTVDYDNAARATPPCIGADEFALPVCSTADAGTISGNGNACDAASNLLSLSAATSGLGVTYQWAYGAVGGPYSNLLGTDATQNTSGIPVGSWEVVCTLTCANCGPCDDTTPAFALTVNALPTVSVDVPTANYCVGATAIAVTASGASTYAWSPAAGLSATTGATVNASPSATTTYTVTGTDGNGCTNTATSAITVIGTSPVITSVTADPNPTCFNGNSALNVVATENTNYQVASVPYALQVGSGAALTFSSNDDGNSTVALPFPFTFFGTAYSTLYVHSNGFASFSSGQPGGSPYTETIPTAATPNNYIAICHDDLNVTGGGVVSTFTTGSAPNRVFVVDYLNVKFYNTAANNGNMSGQILLFEADNSIEVHVTSSDDPVASAHTIGVENATGTAGVAAPGRNNVVYSFTSGTPEAWRFSQAATTYLWTPNTFLSADNVANPSVIGLNVASQAYTVTVTNGNGCAATGNVTVTTTAPITAATITGTLSYCAGGSTTLTAVPSDGAGPYTYVWGPGGQTTASISVTAPGLYEADVFDACGGSAYTGIVIVTENPLPTVAVAPTAADYCVGNPAIALTASGASTYAWTPAAGLDVDNVAAVNASPSTTTTYTVTGTDVNGCVNTTTSTITVLGANPTITSITATPSSICPGGSSQLQVNLPSPSGYCTASAVSTSFEKIAQVQLADINNTSTATAGYEDFTSVVGNVTAGSVYTLTLNVNNAYANNDQLYLWMDVDQNGVFDNPGELLWNDAVSTFCPTCSNAAAVLTGSVTIPAGAVNGSTRIRIRLQDQSSTPNNSTPCGTSQYGQVEDYTVNVTGGSSAASFSWSPAASLSSSTIANPVASPSETTIYSVTVTGPGGCFSTGNTTVTEVTVDDGDPCTLDACVDGVVTNTFQDTDGDGICDANDPCPNLANLVNGDPCDDGNTCTINDVVTGCVCTGTFEDTDMDGICDANDNCPTVPGQLGSACNDGNPLTTGDVLVAGCICQGNAVDCEGTPAGPAVPGSPCDDNDVCTLNDIWSPSCVCAGTFTDTDSDGICDTNDNCPTVPGVQGDACTDGDPCTINDVINASCVCEGTPAPVTAGVTASAANYCTPGPGVTLTATGGDSYSWSPADGLSSTTGSPVTATPSTPTTYTVTVTNLAGCSDTETILVGSGAFPATPVMSATPSTVCPGSDAQLAAQIGSTPSYCTATATTPTSCSGDEFLSNVTFGSISNPSGCTYGSPAFSYNNFTAQSTTVVAGSLGNVLTAGITNLFSGDQMRVWFDWNQDGDFTDLGEEYLPSGAVAATTTFSIDVPAGAVNGSTRMRVRLTWTGVIPACGGAAYGEIEDYTVVVTGGASSCAPGINFSWSPTTFLSDPLICNPVATAVTAATTYTVTATNASGCFSTNTVSLAVETADGDGDGTADCADGCPADPNKIAPGQCGCGAVDTDTDSDGTADCNDGCPADPNKIAAGICGCGVADTDTDSDGTADCNDLCPLDPNKTAPGACGCGVADTDGDGDGIADCNDLCPLVAGTVGTPCNDGNAGTINDQITEECVCAGTTPSCAFNTVLLDLTTDASGSETSWDVVNVGTTTAVCSGSGYLNNQAITLDCCLPDGCYELRVFDSAGDGMANGTVGGYVLRTADGSRIIDNGGDGIFTSTSQIASNLGFCVPLSTDGVIAQHCDKVDWLPGDIIQAQPISAVTAQFGVTNATSGYWYWFFNPDGGYTRRILLTHANPGTVTGAPSNIRASFLRLSDMVSQPLPYFTNLNVRVRRQVAGVVGAFGPACRFRLDPPCSTTQLTVLADPIVSCGATGLTRSNTIYATSVAGANLYQFEFTRPGYTRRITSPTRSQVLNFVTSPLQLNTCYDVRVRMSFDGGQTYCPFGSTCTITLGVATCVEGLVEQDGGNIGSLRSATMNLWPNPNDGTRVNVSLTGFDETINTVGVEVMDLHGRMVSTGTIPVQGGYMNTVLPIEQALAPGLYMVNLQVGDDRYTERLVIQ